MKTLLYKLPSPATDNCGIAVVTFPPQTRTVFLKDTQTARRIKYRLEFPHLVFIITYQEWRPRQWRPGDSTRYRFVSLQLGYSELPIDTLNHVVLGGFLPNTRGHFGVCMVGNCTKPCDSPDEMIPYVISEFWQSDFSTPTWSYDSWRRHLERWHYPQLAREQDRGQSRAVTALVPMYFLKTDTAGLVPTYF